MKNRMIRAGLLSSSLVVAASCLPHDQRTEDFDAEQASQRRETFPEAGLAQLDSGNTAFGEGNHEAALDHYRRATEIMPDNAASWFGIAMSATAMGDSALADSAMIRARELAPGASLIHPNGEGGGGG